MPALIDSWWVDGGRVVVRAGEAFHRRFLRDNFFAEYDPMPDQMAAEVALIPFVANVAPIVWLSGEDWSVPVLDARLADALAEVRSTMRRLHPQRTWNGRLVPERTVTTSEDPSDHAGLVVLFSGGVDSVYTALAHRDRPLRLVTVHGGDIALYDQGSWDAVRGHTEAFATEWGFESAFVRSNFRTFLDIPALERRTRIAEWWLTIQHGLALVGVVAPLVPRVAGSRVLIAATRTPDSTDVIGSAPEIEGALAWGPVTVDHHGFEFSRLDKLGRILEWAVNEGRPTIPLRVCFGSYGLRGENCLRCEKCLRTAAGLLVAGGSVSQLRAGASSREVVDRIRKGFRSLRIASKPYHWKLIQSQARVLRTTADLGGDPALEELVRWLIETDFDRYDRRRRPVARAEKWVVRAFKQFPIADRAARRVRGLWRRVRA